MADLIQHPVAAKKMVEPSAVPTSRVDPEWHLIRRIRESVLTTGNADPKLVRASRINPAILASWRRCSAYGLDPANNRPPLRDADVDTDGPLVRVANAIIVQRESVLAQSMSGLSLTDAHGTVLRKWVPDPAIDRWLEKRNIIPSASVDEIDIGTTSGICLLSNTPTLVRGPEHFCDDYAGMTSAGVPIVHPVTRRTVGSLNLTSRYQDTSPVMVSWVTELVREIEMALQEAATTREQALLNAYTSENRDRRHPLVALDEHTIITNAPAARLLSSVDQAMLWEHASRAMTDNSSDPQHLVLADGTVAEVRCRSVEEGTETIGAVLSIRAVAERKPRHRPQSGQATLPGLVGESNAWRRFCLEASMVGAEPVLIVGERGTGKAAIAKELARGRQIGVHDATDTAVTGEGPWLTALKEDLDRDEIEAIIIRRIDALSDSAATAAANLVQHYGGTTAGRIFATTSSLDHLDQANALLAQFASVLTVPPLRERLDDLPFLLEALTRKISADTGSERETRWMPDAVQALSRLDWHGNIASLYAVVARVLRESSTGYIGAGDLPAEVVANSSRRKLVGLEQIESTAIIAALRQAGGNKNRAAQQLGIARSTLYRKIRALGIDWSASAY